MKYLADLQKFIDPHRNAVNAGPMRKYMKDRFDFLGIKSPERNALLQEFLKKEGKPDREKAENIAIGLWSLPYREYQYLGMELVDKIIKKPDPEDIYFIEYMLEYKQWWDTVDFIATHLVGRLFQQHPAVRDKYFQKWNESNDLWLNRTAILFQLKYQKDTDLKILKKAILKHHNSKEFFHQKAIGWILREYAKTDEQWVRNFTEKHSLSNLSKERR